MSDLGWANTGRWCPSPATAGPVLPPAPPAPGHVRLCRAGLAVGAMGSAHNNWPDPLRARALRTGSLLAFAVFVLRRLLVSCSSPALALLTVPVSEGMTKKLSCLQNFDQPSTREGPAAAGLWQRKGLTPAAAGALQLTQLGSRAAVQPPRSQPQEPWVPVLRGVQPPRSRPQEPWVPALRGVQQPHMQESPPALLCAGQEGRGLQGECTPVPVLRGRQEHCGLWWDLG